MSYQDINIGAQLENTSTIFMRCVDKLYNSGVPNRPELILFLVSAHRDGLFTEDLSNDRIGLLERLRDKLNTDSFYKKLLPFFIKEIEYVHSNNLIEIIRGLFSIDRKFLKMNFKEVFEHLLMEVIKFKGKHSGESIQPREITQFIIELADLKGNDKVYNPFAGLGSFGVNLDGNQEYYGQEIDGYNWALGQLRLKAHNKNLTQNYKLEDSVNNWNNIEKFDLVVANPPFKGLIRRFHLSGLLEETSRNIHSFLIDRGINSLNNNGKLITVFPLSFLFSSGREARFKKWLIDNNLLDTIILLPSDLLSNTNIPVCIIICKKVITRPGYVKFIDGSSFYKKTDIRNKILNYKDLLDSIQQGEENQYIKYIDVESIYNNDFNLSVSRYFIRNIQGVKLISFSNIIKGIKATVNQKMKQVQIGNLKDDVFDCILNSGELESKIIKRTTFSVIEESCLLIATRWNTLKPTYFRYSGEPIVISQAVVALKLDENVVDPTFLISEFSAGYIQEQINSYRVGSVQPMLRTKDLINIMVQLPSIKEQKAKVSGIIELSQRLRKLEFEKENILKGRQDEKTGSSTSLSHILGKPLLSIGSSIEIIQNALSRLNPEWRDQLISPKRQFTLADAFESISKNVKYIQELADKNTSMVSVSIFPLTELHFLQFLSKFVSNEKKSLSLNIALHLDVHSDIKEQMGNQVLIKGNAQKLRIVMLNLIDNAKNHAFTDKNQSYKINIEILPFTGNEQEASYLNYDIDERKSYVEVKISNTGKTFPKDFKLADYVRKNFSAGLNSNRGLGGYEVNEILKTHNEGRKALNLISNQNNSKYSSTISFVLPLI